MRYIILGVQALSTGTGSVQHTTNLRGPIIELEKVNRYTRHDSLECLIKNLGAKKQCHVGNSAMSSNLQVSFSTFPSPIWSSLPASPYNPNGLDFQPWNLATNRKKEVSAECPSYPIELPRGFGFGPFLVSRTGDAGWTEREVKVPECTLIRHHKRC